MESSCAVVAGRHPEALVLSLTKGVQRNSALRSSFTRSAKIFHTLAIRSVVGRLTLDQQTQVRILDRQPKTGDNIVSAAIGGPFV